MEASEADSIQGKIREELKPVKIKKFYKKASVVGKEAPFNVALDGRKIKTPLKSVLEIPTKSLADAIAVEWNEQGEFIEIGLMHLAKYANIAIDQVGLRKEQTVDEITSYASSDLVCCRADTPQGLVERQALSWDPVLEWAENTHKLNFICVAGVIYTNQPVNSLALFHELLSRRDDHSLTVVHNITTMIGSALLALSVVEGGISRDDCWNAAHLDEDWNIELWGTDEDASTRRVQRRAEFDALLAFHDLLN